MSFTFTTKRTFSNCLLCRGCTNVLTSITLIPRRIEYFNYIFPTLKRYVILVSLSPVINNFFCIRNKFVLFNHTQTSFIKFLHLTRHFIHLRRTKLLDSLTCKFIRDTRYWMITSILAMLSCKLITFKSMLCFKIVSSFSISYTCIFTRLLKFINSFKQRLNIFSTMLVKLNNCFVIEYLKMFKHVVKHINTRCTIFFVAKLF